MSNLYPLEPIFETRQQVVDWLVENMGMSLPFAKAAVDQQYNYDSHPEGAPGGGLLRGMYEDLDIAGTQTVHDLREVHATWVEMLSIEGNAICVDGEPIYDLQGNLL